jgi:hypothetical protein
LYGGATGTPCSGLVLLRNIAAKREGISDRLYGVTAGVSLISAKRRGSRLVGVKPLMVAIQTKGDLA